jgi:hypothetical protein
MWKGLKNKYITWKCSRQESIKSIGSSNTYYLYHSNTIFNKCRSISFELQMLKVLKCVRHCYWLPPLKLGNAVCLRSAKLLHIFPHLNCKNFNLQHHLLSKWKKNHYEDVRMVMLLQYYDSYLLVVGTPQSSFFFLLWRASLIGPWHGKLIQLWIDSN